MKWVVITMQRLETPEPRAVVKELDHQTFDSKDEAIEYYEKKKRDFQWAGVFDRYVTWPRPQEEQV